MGISVYVSATLRTFVNRNARIELEGNTVRDILDNLKEEYPDSRKGLFEEDGTRRPYVSVFVNGNAVSVKAEDRKSVV